MAWAWVGCTVFAAPEVFNGELIVRFRNGLRPSEIDRTTRAARLRVKRHVHTQAMKRDGHPGLIVVTAQQDTAQTLALLRNDPGVAYAEPNYTIHTLATSDDPYFTSGNLWGMYGDLSTPANPYGSQAAEAWAAGYVGSSSVYVAVIDDGMQITHPELSPNVWINPYDPPDGIDNDGNGFIDDVNGWNFAAGTNVVFTGGDNHGTHVAGIIGAKGGNGAGVAGVNWNVTLIPLKFIVGGSGSTDAAVQAIDYCVDLKTRHGINLVAINASWGGSAYSQSLHEAIIRAAKAGILFVVAAGNSSGNNDVTDAIPANLDPTFGTLNETPATYNNVICVAAIDSTGALASFSNYGATRVHIGAPGVSIYSSYPTNLIGGLSGTSMATPHVTGAVALYASTHPTATAMQIRSAILTAALPTPSLQGKVSTGGRLNLSDVVLPLPAPAAAAAMLVSETWTNGVIDPGENVMVQLTLTNPVPFGTANLTATLLATSGVLNPSAAQNFGALVAGGSAASRTFSFSADGTCGENLNLILSLQDGITNFGTVTFTLPLGTATNSFSENFDAVTIPALPTGWAVALTGAGAKWKTVSNLAGSGPNAIYAPNPGSQADNLLTSPPIHVRSGSATLSFSHQFNLEQGWDGGVLEISIAGGAFADIVIAGGSFLQNGYNRKLESSTVPLAGRWAWSGDSGGFISTTVLLPASCLNQDVQLRWRCGSDTSMGGTGWYVDSVALADGTVCSLGTVTLAEDQASVPTPFNIGHADAQTGLQLSASAQDPILLPAPNISLNGSGPVRSFTLLPGTNEFGSTAVTLTVASDVATSYRTFNLVVSPVNDPPSFISGGNLTIPQDSGAQTVFNWATSISPGPANESAQQLTFHLNVDDLTLFSAPPAVDPTGALSFSPATHRRGTAQISVALQDDGGTAQSGQDTSSPANFTITIGQSTDTDGDGLPDDFETVFSLNPNSAADAAVDTDGDGFTNLQEFLAGTDPLDPRSSLRILGAQDPTSASGVQFSSVLGKTYSIDQNTNYPAAAWQGLGSGKSGTGSLLIEADGTSGSAPLKLYRVTTSGETGGTVSSEFAGFCRLNLLGNSDTFVSIPFSRPPADFGAVLSTVSQSGIVQMQPSPNWTLNQWVYSSPAQTNTYYALIRSGALAGQYFTITGNTADSLTLDLQGGTLAQLASGDALAIVPYWTLGTIFPGGEGIHPSLNPGIRATEILFPDLASAGINLSATATYYFFNGIWRQVGQGGTNKSDNVVLPDMYFTVRHNVSGATTLTTQGLMLAGGLQVPIRRQGSAKQDNAVALTRPVQLTLDQSGLIQSGAFRASLFPGLRTDELLVFDNTTVGRNKSASATYYYLNGTWRKVGAGGTDVGSDIVFTPGTGVILRSGSGSPVSWQIPSGY